MHKPQPPSFALRSWQPKYGLKYPYILLSVMGIVSSCSLSPAWCEHIYYPGWIPKYPQREAVLREPNGFSSSSHLWFSNPKRGSVKHFGWGHTQSLVCRNPLQQCKMFLSAQLRKRVRINKNKPRVSVLLYASMKLDRVLTDLLRKKKLITYIHFNKATEMLE